MFSLEESRPNVIFMDDDAEDDETVDKIYGSIEKVISVGGEDVYAEMLYTSQQPGGGESIYGMGATTPDEKRNCVVCGMHSDVVTMI